jgi:chromosome segregation ATPase
VHQQGRDNAAVGSGQQTDWTGQPDTNSARSPADSAAVLSHLEDLLASVQASPESHPDWEAACLMSVADLLENLGKARSGWGSLAGRLTEARSRVDAAKTREETIRRDLVESTRLLEETKRDLAEARRETEKIADLDGQIRRLRTELDAAQYRIGEADRLDEERQAAQERNSSLQSELDETKWQLAELTRERDEATGQVDALRAENEALKQEAEGLRSRLAEMEAQLTEAHQQAASQPDSSEQVEAVRREMDRLKRDHEQDLVALCDLRVTVNRLEQERDAALKERKRKVKKILAKVHAALDEAGAPHGDEMSFGERIRRLAGQGDDDIIEL